MPACLLTKFLVDLDEIWLVAFVDLMNSYKCLFCMSIFKVINFFV